MEKLFSIYKRLLELHIQTKTTDLVFHQASEKFYDLMFSVFHDISEKRQDNELDVAIDCEVAWQEAYDLLEEAKAEIESMIEWENTKWMDNLLRGIVDKLEFACWTARGFVKKEKEEEEESKKEEEKPTKKEEPTTKWVPMKK